jgi:hypothetical protein
LINCDGFLHAFDICDAGKPPPLIFWKEYWSGGHTPRGYRVEHEVNDRKRDGDARYGGRLVKDEALADRVALACRMNLEENASYERIHEATRLYSNR